MKLQSCAWICLGTLASFIVVLSISIQIWVYGSAVDYSEHDTGKTTSDQPLQPGRLLRKEFFFEPAYVPLNHGSYGTYPKAVSTALHEYQRRAETNPDLFLRRQVRPELAKVRGMIANLINCDTEDIVVVPNTTGGMNAIFRSLVFDFGDRILHLNTVYGSMGSLIQYIVDSSKGRVSKLVFNVTYPMSNDDFVSKLDDFLEEQDDPKRPIRIALIDHITSVPAVVNPIERIIPMLKRRNILALIDGAHAIGQVPINIKALAPDFYITNCHKWLYASRGTAILYVDKKHQGLIHPAHINAAYTQPASFQDEFFWTGTMDYSPYLTVLAALEFRRRLGGEDVVMQYNHNLAHDGGKYLATRLGTEVLQYEDQIGSMVDVRLPIKNPDDPKFDYTFWVNLQLYKYKETYIPVYKQNGQWWIRVSAQIYNDMSDFEVAVQHFMAICKEVNENFLNATQSENILQ